MGAGLGFKTFVTGDVLTATDTNGYLMQGVWVFADAAARTAAVTSPQEGNMSYLKDTNSTEYYSGSAWVAVGGTTNNSLNALVNPVINGGMDIWQRGTSFTSGAYSADRWRWYSANVGRTITRQTVSDSTNLPNIQYSMRIARDSGNTTTGQVSVANSFETVNSIPFAGKTVTLSFYAKAGANFSAASNSIQALLYTGTGTDQSIIDTGYTGQATPINQSVVLTTTWQRFAYTGTIASTTTEIAVRFDTNAFVGTAGANDWVEVTGAQIDVGTYTASTAPTFRRTGGTIQGELAACQRYYYRTSPTASGMPVTSNGGCITTTIGQVYYPLPVTMRSNPSAMEYSAINWYNYGNNTEYNTGTYTLSTATPNLASVRYTHGSAVFTAGQSGGFTTAGASSYLAFTAEL